MMKTKNINQLQSEKQLIWNRKKELEKEIFGTWNELKDALNPADKIKNALDNVWADKILQKQNNKGILRNAVNFGLALLADKLLSKAENLFDRK